MEAAAHPQSARTAANVLESELWNGGQNSPTKGCSSVLGKAAKGWLLALGSVRYSECLKGV